MSDQKKNNTDRPAGKPTTEENTVSVDTPSAAAGTATITTAPKKSSSVIAWLALLGVVALLSGAVFLLQEAHTREADALARLTALEADAGREQSDLNSLEQSWAQQLGSSVVGIQTEMDTTVSRLTQALASLETQLADQRTELARYSANDRDSWLIAEAEYLLRLANQRLLMAGDTSAAQALLSSADNVLRELDDPALHAVRGAVAADLAAIRAVPSIDVQGIYLRLAALVEQAANLQIFTMRKVEAQPTEAVAEDWRGRLEEGYAQALVTLSDYIIIRRRDVPMQALMDPQWEGLVRQNLRMLLEQAQVALLSGNQHLYGASLSRARHWVGQFMESDEAAARSISRELTQLSDMKIAAVLPDISRSAQALDDAIEQRQQRGGDE